MDKVGKRLRKFGARLFSRPVVTALLLLAQVLWIALIFSRLADYARWLNGAGLVLSIVMCFVLVRQDSTAPEFKISWIILFIVMPAPGGLLYLMWGDKRPAWKLRRKLARAVGTVQPLRTAAQAPQPMQALQAASPRLAATAAYLRRNGFPLYGGTEATYYAGGEAFFADLLPALESAEHFIFVEFFIISQGSMWQAVLDVLRRKAAAGVDVRVIYDDAGCAAGLPNHYWRRLEAEGIRAVPFNPFVPMLNLVMNNRDHRKIVVVDGDTAFTGGANLADEYINRIARFGHWRDSAVRLRGAAAWSFTTMFLEFWAANRPDEPAPDPAVFRPRLAVPEADCLVQPFCDSPVDRENVARNVYLELINQAQRRLSICTPYLVLDNDLLTALRLAARRGVDLRIYTPGIPDKKTIYQLTRSYFAPLLEAGVKIFTYTPGFLHNKTWLCDDRVGVVGSVNLDYRSLYLHFECAALLYGGRALADIERDFADIEAHSAPVALADCRTSIPGTLVSAVLRLLAPLC